MRHHNPLQRQHRHILHHILLLRRIHPDRLLPRVRRHHETNILRLHLHRQFARHVARLPALHRVRNVAVIRAFPAPPVRAGHRDGPLRVAEVDCLAVDRRRPRELELEVDFGTGPAVHHGLRAEVRDAHVAVAVVGGDFHGEGGLFFGVLGSLR